VKAFLGTKFEGHDTAAFLLVPGSRSAFGVATERLTRVKHDRLTPLRAILHVAACAGNDRDYIDEVVCANSFSSHRDRLVRSATYLEHLECRAITPSDIEIAFAKSAPALESLHSAMQRALALIFPDKHVTLRHFDHEYCHARSAFHLSSFEEALVVTLDGSGDYGVFSRVYLASGRNLRELAASRCDLRISVDTAGREFSQPASLGGLYAYFTHLIGYEANCEEGKVEALAAFGRPIPEITTALQKACFLSVEKRRLELDPVGLEALIVLTQAGAEERQRADFAATMQNFLETLACEYISLLVQTTGTRALCVSGGVFANVLLNMRLAELVDEIYVAPAMGDDGSAQGAAIAAWLHEEPGADLEWLASTVMPYFGAVPDRSALAGALDKYKNAIDVETLGSNGAALVAGRLAAGEVGALYHGRSEFGPRALGNRSILASASRGKMRRRINLDVKRRPPFQPVCPAMLKQERQRLFERAYDNVHMTCAFEMKAEHREALADAIHVDGTARVQFVDSTTNPFLHEILLQMKERTGYGVVLNTSFNLHGRAMVETPNDALRDFLDAGLDFLAIEGLLVTAKQRDRRDL